mmetsp:Transcript_75655/g.165072  ORF Transcript_75655/g.165072 Transcript_75655/m.165072 type:complete len:217 (-) Transcript_75655:690-1340(-)
MVVEAFLFPFQIANHSRHTVTLPVYLVFSFSQARFHFFLQAEDLSFQLKLDGSFGPFLVPIDAGSSLEELDSLPGVLGNAGLEAPNEDFELFDLSVQVGLNGLLLVFEVLKLRFDLPQVLQIHGSHRVFDLLHSFLDTSAAICVPFQLSKAHIHREDGSVVAGLFQPHQGVAVRWGTGLTLVSDHVLREEFYASSESIHIVGVGPLLVSFLPLHLL